MVRLFHPCDLIYLEIRYLTVRTDGNRKKMNEGKLMKSTLKNPKRILDVGTGTGNWAIEIADQFPNADIVGTDLSPIQDSEAPPNCHFFIDDCEDDWGWEERFDFVHARSLGGGISNWRQFYRQCFKNMTPGAQVEIQEHDFTITSQIKDIPKWISHWQHELAAAYRTFGKNLQTPIEKHIQYLREAGFTNVKSETIAIPIGAWAKDERLKKIGEWNQRQTLELVESYSLAPYTEILKKSLEETQVTLAMTKGELREKKHHLITKFHFITGTKPLCR